jgi:hypothetical protein
MLQRMLDITREEIVDAIEYYFGDV